MPRISSDLSRLCFSYHFQSWCCLASLVSLAFSSHGHLLLHCFPPETLSSNQNNNKKILTQHFEGRDMAEAVVTFVLEKIGEAAYQEALIQYGAKGKVEWAKRELRWMSAFLKDADAKAKQNLDNRVKQWVKDVKEVAYMIEDVLDKYLVEVQGGPKELGVLKKIRSMPNILVARHRVSKEIDDIKERVREIKENAVNYGIEKLSDGRTGSGPANNPVDWPKFPDVDEATVVGFTSHVNQIVQQLTDKRNLERSVISIVGTGGLGKTTLAKLVYKRLIGLLEPIGRDSEHHRQVATWMSILRSARPLLRSAG